jgi:hypothetical protein
METSSSLTQGEPGVAMSKAHEHYCSPDLLERYMAAGKSAGWSISGLAYRMGGLTPEESWKAAARAEYQAAWNRVVRDLVTKLRDGRLSGMGFVVTPSGRDLDAGRRVIPADVLSFRTCRLDWRNETISGNGLEFVGVRIFSTYETPESAASLVGHSLSECFKLVVADDWVRQEMEEPVFRRFPDWKISPDSYTFHPSYRWPVHYEGWAAPAFSVSQQKHPVIALNREWPRPPDGVVAIRRRIEQRVCHLLNWLRDGTLVAEGIAEPPDHALTRRAIPADWWRKPEVEFDHAESGLWNLVGRERIRVFSDIRLVAPLDVSRDEAPRGEAAAPSRSKGKPGRKAKWDWDAASRELMRLACSKEGLPKTQAEIEQHLADWFLDNFDDHPAESATRDFLAKRLPPDYHDEN